MICLWTLGCLSGADRQGPPRLIVSPGAAYEGDRLSLTLSAEGVNLKKCANTVDSLRFSNGKEPAAITVHSIDAIANVNDSVRVFIEIEMGAAGENDGQDYDVSFRCNSATTFTGRFHVKRIPSEVLLTLSPTSAAANSYNQTITLSTEEPFFEAGADIYVMFGSGEYVTVSQWKRVNDREMELIISVDASAPKGTVPVAVVKGEKVARGAFDIEDRIKSFIFVSPGEVYRQGADDLVPRVHDITIRGEGIDFVEADPDNGVGEDEATAVTFPEEPSIRVSNLEVIEVPGETTNEDGDPVVTLEKQLAVKIVVDQLAQLRATPLQVTTGDVSAWTTLSVRLPPDTPYLKIENQKPVPRNGKRTHVYVRAVNFEFDEVQSVTCVEDPGCDVVSYSLSGEPPRKMLIEMVVDVNYELPFATLQVVTAEHQVQERIMIGDQDPIDLTADVDFLIQGDPRQWVLFTLTGGGKFDSGSTVSVLPRSGLKITYEVFDSEDPKRYSVRFDVAKDAPTGPAYIQFISGSDVYVAPLYVKPSEEVPYVSLTPSSTLRRRNIMALRLTTGGEGWALSSDPSRYRFDDPALEVIDAALDPPGDTAAQLAVSVSPGARTDMSVLYVTGESSERAAATFAVLEPPSLQVMEPDVDEVNRGSTRTFTLTAPGVQFKQPGISIADNIGLRALRPQDGSTFVFDLTADREYSSDGWTGLIIDNEFNQYLTAIHINSDYNTNSLTAMMSPSSVPQGSHNVAITAYLPDEMTVALSELDVVVDAPGVFVASPQMLGIRAVSFILDVGYSASGEIPVFITTARGAAVGFIYIEPLESVEVDGASSFSDILPVDRSTKIEVDPGEIPSVLRFSSGEPNRTDVTAHLIASNNLDVADTAAGGELWITRGGETMVDGIAHVGTLPADIVVMSWGPNAVREGNLDIGENDEEYYEWELTEDPCVTPFLGSGVIDPALDVDRVMVGTTGCRLAAAVVARQMADRPWDTPDLWMEVRDDSDLLVGAMRSTGWPDPRDPDPRLLLDMDMDDVVVAVGSELASAGEYFLNIRRPYTIRELSRAANESFIELELWEGSDLDDLELILIDIATGSIVDRLQFSEVTVENDGVVVIAGQEMAEADVNHPVAQLPVSGPFVIALQKGGALMDAVQLGEGSEPASEGDPIPEEDGVPVYYRPFGLDTNNNAKDFLSRYWGDPGQ